MRRGSRWNDVVAFALIVGAVAAGPSAGPGLAQEPFLVKIGQLPAFSNAPLYLAIERGFFQEQGLKVELLDFASGGVMMTPLATDLIQVAMGAASAGLYNSIAQGMDIKIVADKGQVRPGHGFASIMVVRKDLVDSGAVKSIRDLKGKKVAILAKGIGMHFDLYRYLKSEGLSLDDVQLVFLPSPKMFQALQQKAIDVYLAPDPWGARAEGAGVGVRFRTMDQIKGMEQEQVAVVMYSGKFIRERPREARSWMRAYLRGIAYYNARGQKDPEVVRVVSKFTKVPERDILASIPFHIDPEGRPDLQALARQQDWFFEQGFVKQRVPLERVVDLSFLRDR